MKRNAIRGFSLVELSIVLVIVGLLVGGVLAGQSLVRASELRSVSSDVDRYNTAVLAFRDKYFALPGDMANATSFWGAAADCTAQTATGQSTCNGNSDGEVIWQSGVAGNRSEFFTFWQHLSNAGLVEGNYTGVRGPGTYSASSAPGTNTPALKIGGCINPMRGTQLSSYNNINPSVPRNVFVAGKLSNADLANPDFCVYPMLKGEEAWNIDTKMDDGRPATGHVFVRATSSNCLTNLTDPALAQYTLSSAVVACTFYIAMK